MDLYEINFSGLEHKHKDLYKSLLLRKLEESPQILLNRSGLNKLNLDTLIDIIQEESEIPQATRYSALTQWAEMECNRRKVMLSYENKRKLLGPNIPEKLIKFHEMSLVEFSDIVSNDNLMSASFIIETFRQFTGSKNNALKREFNKLIRDKRFRIRCTVDSKVITLAISPNNHVEDVKAVLAEHPDGFPFHEQRIVFTGQQLEDGRTLASYNIQDKDMLHILRKISLSRISE